MSIHLLRSKWSAVGAAIAVSLGAGGIGITHATTSTGEKPIYLPIEPCRLADTRAAFQVGPRSAPLGPNETYTLSGQGAVGNCNLPAGTTALSLNVTAIDATAPTFLTLFPAGGSLPVASHLNPLPGQGPVPNAVNVDLNVGGEFSVYNLAGNVHIIIDVVGIFDDHNHDDRYYTETEVDAALGTKANSADVYTRAESNARFDNGQANGVNDASDTVTGVDEIIASTTLDTPSVGFITAIANTSIFGFGVDAQVRCSITTGLTVADNIFLTDVLANDWASLAGTRTISVSLVPVSGETTVNLVCDGSGNNLLGDSNLSAIFTPDQDAGFILIPLGDE